MKQVSNTANRSTMGRPTWRPAVIRLLVGATLSATGALASLPGALSQAQSAAPRPALSVSAITPTREALALQLPANGSIAAWDEAPIGSETAGLRLLEIRAAVGDTVRRGEVLAVFSSATLEADLAQAEAAVRELRAQWTEARDNAERARSLRGTDALSATQIAQYLYAEEIALARLQGGQAQEQGVRARLAQTRVLAPDSGVISARSASVGSVPQPGQELFRLIRQGRLEWRAELTSDELLRIKPGTPAQLDLPGGISMTGRVRMLAPLVDPQTRNAVVHVDVAAMNTPEGARLRPGMFVRGRFLMGQSSTLVVPQSAIAMRDGFSYVFRIEPDQRVTQLRIQTGRISADRVEILSGLKGDETLVASGAGFLNDGDQVRVVPAPAGRR